MQSAEQMNVDMLTASLKAQRDRDEAWAARVAESIASYRRRFVPADQP